MVLGHELTHRLLGLDRQDEVLEAPRRHGLRYQRAGSGTGRQGGHPSVAAVARLKLRQQPVRQDGVILRTLVGCERFYGLAHLEIHRPAGSP